VVALLPVAGGIAVIRSNIELKMGTIALPGGDIDLGETWQEAGKRELREETSIDIGAGELKLYEVMNGPGRHPCGLRPREPEGPRYPATVKLTGGRPH
jgi:ADP-ribose pyrophosphatase YjhB (NUDIX family)